MSNVYPAIPDPQPTPESLAESVRMLKLGMEVLTGQRAGGAPTRTFIQDATPTALSKGDEWFDSSGKHRYWDGKEWLLVYQTPAADIQALLDSISSTQGTILFRGASSWTSLAPTTAGYLLQTNGAAANPSWVAPPAVSPWTQGVKTSADQSRTSSTALTDATDMSFAVAANTYYDFQFVLLTSGGLGGLQVSVTCPASPTSFLFSPVNFLGATTSGAAVTIFGTPASSWAISLIVSGYLNNGANAGNVQLQFAQQTSNATATVLRKGSWFQYRTV